METTNDGLEGTELTRGRPRILIPGLLRSPNQLQQVILSLRKIICFKLRIKWHIQSVTAGPPRSPPKCAICEPPSHQQTHKVPRLSLRPLGCPVIYAAPQSPLRVSSDSLPLLGCFGPLDFAVNLKRRTLLLLTRSFLASGGNCSPEGLSFDCLPQHEPQTPTANATSSRWLQPSGILTSKNPGWGFSRLIWAHSSLTASSYLVKYL